MIGVLVPVFFMLLVLSVPVGHVLLMASGASIMAMDFLPLNIIVQQMFGQTQSFPMLALPFFILAGNLMMSGALGQKLIRFASMLVQRYRGGPLSASVVGSAVFGGVSGSAVADATALGSMLIPWQKGEGFPADFAAANNASSAMLAVLIPPSIPMILYAVMADSSVVQLFVAGIVPGVLGAAMLMGLSYWFAVRYSFPVEEAFRLRHLWVTFKEAAWAFLLPIIILGGIFGGLVTATEGAGLAVAAALFIGGVIYRELDWRQLFGSLKDGAIQTAVVMLLVATSALLGQYLTQARVPQMLTQAIISLTQDKYAVLAMLNVLFLVLGMFLHGAAAIILVVPIVLPIVHSVGIDPVHFGLVVTLNLAIGQQTPPVASVLITACSIAKADIWEVTKINVYFIAVLFALLMLITYVPAVPMTLVEIFYR